MSVPLADIIDRIDPINTVLFFGAGSSLASGAPSVEKLIEKICGHFGIVPEGYSLTEVASLAEEKRSRSEFITYLRSLFVNVHITGSLLNLPLYNWRNIYTTNYDDLIEQAYSRTGKSISVITSNYDFREQRLPELTKLYKLHGTIGKDICDGVQSRIIVSEADYDNTIDYREALWNALRHDLNGANLVIIGYSLADKHIKEIIDQAISINNKSQSPASISLVLYSRDENRALLLEKRGLKVAFGGTDDFFLELQKRNTQNSLVYSSTGNPLDSQSILQAVTLIVDDELKNIEKNVSSMFQGWPATYSDIRAQLTFDRTLLKDVEAALHLDNIISVTILGASGTGKSTLARQTSLRLKDRGFHCWEHKSTHKLLSSEWREVAKLLTINKQNGILLIDDAHNHLFEINNLIDLLSADKCFRLKLILTSSRSQWNPRIKTPNIFTKGKQFVLKKLDEAEIESLLTLVDYNPDLSTLVENSFSGFSRIERKRRLIVKCESDTFVCLKNIFASEKFDDIVLREYAELNENLRQIYRLISAMESAGINVHRQLVIRLLGVDPESISATLTNLKDIIHEYTFSAREGIYGWRGRHAVITDIITKYKMTDEQEYYNLFETVIDNLIPTYDIEIRTIKQLCNFDSGISRFPDKHVRNKLLRKMISKVPGERVPRHRLIRNLIDVHELEKADTEIRLYENDLKPDGPVERFKIMLLLARADRTSGILDEDRLAILEMARKKSIEAVDRYRGNKNILTTYCDVGIEFYKRTKTVNVFDDAMNKLRDAESRLGDPEITTYLINYERHFSRLQSEMSDDDITMQLRALFSELD